MVLIAAIPVLMFAELMHGSKTKPVEETQEEVSYKNPAVVDSIMPFTQAVFN